MAKRIAVLMHARQTPAHARGYVVGLMAEMWRADGHEVVFLFGTERFEPADLILVHVDLSVVPDEYLDFAARYPIALNARLRDVRKSTYSRGLLAPGDRWHGQVIVKSNLNYAGAPERRLLDEGHPSRRRAAGFRHPGDYLIFDDLSLVPPRYFEDRLLIVQRFVPEMSGGLYCVRHLSVLGERATCLRLLGTHPIVNGPTVQRVEPCEPDEEIIAERRELGFDYGKLDYVVPESGPLLLDANKTVGVAAKLVDDPVMLEARRERARGLYDYFRGT